MYIFVAITGCFATILLGLFIWEQKCGKTEKKEKKSFKILSSLTSVWLPCVVGTARYTFLRSALLSIASKLVLLVIAVLLNYFPAINTNVFLLWCYDVPTAEAKVKSHYASQFNGLWTMDICQEFSDSSSYPPCYGSGSSRLSQKIRICAAPATENAIWITTAFLVLGSTAASCFAAFNLQKQSDYLTLWERTKTLCYGVISMEPMVHRSLLFDYTKDDSDHVKLTEILAVDEVPPTPNQVQAVNRTYKGETPLDHALRKGATECARILRKAGAFEPTEEVFSLASHDKNLVKLLEYLDIDPLSEESPTKTQIKKANRRLAGKSLIEWSVQNEALRCAGVLQKAGATEASSFLDPKVFELAGDDENSTQLADFLAWPGFPGFPDISGDEAPNQEQRRNASRRLEGKTLLEHAYKNGATDCVNIICKAGAEDANTFLASKLVGDNANCEKVADLLGIDMSFEGLPSEDQIKRITNTFLGETLLDRAAYSRATECIKLLGKAGAVQNQEDAFLVKYANGGKVMTSCPRQGGRSWQPFGESKNGHKTFVRRVFAIFTTNASFLRVIANSKI